MDDAHMNDNPSLPHGVNKLDLGEAILIFCEDKIVFQPKNGDDHWTLHFGPFTKTLDIHRTRRTAGGAVEYETLYRINHDRLASLLEEVSDDLVNAFRSLLRPLRIDQMVRHHLDAEPGFFPPESELEGITTVRKKRLYVDESKILDRIGKLDYLDDLLELPDGRGFSLICYKNPSVPEHFGAGYKVTDPWGRSQLVWFSYRHAERKLTALIERLMPKFKEAMLENDPLGSEGRHEG